MREVTAHPLYTGSCRAAEAMTIAGGAWRMADIPAVAMLIFHPEQGAILFDTGYDAAFLAATQRFPERLYRWAAPVNIPAGSDAASQCLARGIEPGDVRHVVLSHFHGDHIAGLHRFPNAAIHCARAGLEDARRGGRFSGTRRGILSTLIPPDITARARYFEDRRIVNLPPELAPFADGMDVLGDGSLIAMELPGHCPGHWGLLIDDGRWGRHFLVGDAAWSLAAIRRNAPPPAFTSQMLGDTRLVRQTLNALHLLHRNNPGIRLTPFHCPERAAEALVLR